MSALAAWFNGLSIGVQITIAMQISFLIGWVSGFFFGRSRRGIKRGDR